VNIPGYYDCRCNASYGGDGKQYCGGECPKQLYYIGEIIVIIIFIIIIKPKKKQQQQQQPTKNKQIEGDYKIVDSSKCMSKQKRKCFGIF